MNAPSVRLAPGLLGLCLAGPTATGKSALAMALAAQLPLEIISVDSALVYRGMDIGTAKPSATDQAATPHHLIDILDPSQSYSAAQFVSDAQRLAADIRARGRLPLLVGGTMLYFKALREGLDSMPAADPAVRAQIDKQAAAQGWPALHAELARVDTPTATRLAPADAQRIQRALEVYRLSGRPLSDWQQNQDRIKTAQCIDETRRAWPLITLEPQSRAWLHQRIAERFEAMLAAGFLDEVQALRQRGDLHPGLPALRCVGYRQAWAALEGGSVQGLRESAVAATRQLAKRQLTWLRRMTPKTQIECDTEGAAARALLALCRAATQQA